MKTPIEKSESLKKALDGSKVFDEADYYKSKQTEMGGDKVIEKMEEEFEEDEEDDDHVEDHEYYGDD